MSRFSNCDGDRIIVAIKFVLAGICFLLTSTTREGGGGYVWLKHLLAAFVIIFCWNSAASDYLVGFLSIIVN
jgi:hypothetical protein